MMNSYKRHQKRKYQRGCNNLLRVLKNVFIYYYRHV